MLQIFLTDIFYSFEFWNCLLTDGELLYFMGKNNNFIVSENWMITNTKILHANSIPPFHSHYQCWNTCIYQKSPMTVFLCYPLHFRPLSRDGPSSCQICWDPETRFLSFSSIGNPYLFALRQAGDTPRTYSNQDSHWILTFLNHLIESSSF